MQNDIIKKYIKTYKSYKPEVIMEIKLGKLLVDDYRLTNEQIHIALDFQQSNTVYKGKKLGQILISLGWLEESNLDRYLVLQKENFFMENDNL